MKRSRSPSTDKNHLGGDASNKATSQTAENFPSKPSASTSGNPNGKNNNKDIPLKPTVAEHVNLYQIVGVRHSATTSDLRAAMKKSALKFHPDRNVGREEEAKLQFQTLNEAFAVLLDEGQRRQHDTKLGLNFGSKVGDLLSQMNAHHEGHHRHSNNEPKVEHFEDKASDEDKTKTDKSDNDEEDFCP